MNKIHFRRLVFLSNRFAFRIISALFFWGLVLTPVRPTDVVPITPTEPVGLAKVTGKPTLLQYTSTDGHVLGFAPDKVYLAGLDHALTVEFVGGQKVTPVGETGQTVSSKSGNSPTLGRVTYKDMWHGVDVIYTPSQSGLVESTYILNPGSNLADIRLKYNAPVELMNGGTLRFAFETGYMTESAPTAYQEIEGKRMPVTVSFSESKGLVGLKSSVYNSNYALIIDPIYSWHEHYGSDNRDYGRSIAIDGSGIYVTGSSDTSWNGPGSVAPLNAYVGGKDIVVIKLNSAGVYQWHTFYGSSDSDQGNAITSDGSGNIYIAGSSHASWNGLGSLVPLNAFTGSYSYDIVVIKLNSAGVYQWHTFYGSSDSDQGRGITIYGSGIYVAGESIVESSAAWTGPGDKSPLHAYAGGKDIVVIKLNSAGGYQWHTFYGSADDDECNGIASDASGVYVVGGSSATWNGPGSIAPQNAFTEPNPNEASWTAFNIMVVKLSNTGAYTWHTFFGSTSLDSAYGVTVSGSGVYVIGVSQEVWYGPGSIDPLNIASGGFTFTTVAIKLNSTNGVYQWHTFYGNSFPEDWGDLPPRFDMAITSDVSGNVYLTYDDSPREVGDHLPLNTYMGIYDIAVVKLNSAGQYQWHTYYGSTSVDHGYAIASGGNEVYMVGRSNAMWNGPGDATPLNTQGNGSDITIVKLNDAGAYQWHTFYGSPDDNQAFGIASDKSGNIYVAGYSAAAWNGLSAAAPLNAYADNNDIVVVKLNSLGTYQWHTFYGSSGLDKAYGIVSDGSGIYVVGESQAAWNGPELEAPLNAYTGGVDLVVVKLDSNGVYQWHTFYGSTSDDFGHAITVDNNNVYIVGNSWGTWDGPDSSAPLNAYSGGIVVVKLSNEGVYQWHTFYGSADYDNGLAVVSDVSGVYVAGYSNADWDGPGSIAPLNAYVGGSDIVVIKLDSAGVYQWHTFYGSPNGDEGMSLVSDGSGIYVAGRSWSTWDGPGATAPLNPYAGDSDIVVVKLDRTGTYQWHTFYGSLSNDVGYAIANDPNGNVYVAGSSAASWNGPGSIAPLDFYYPLGRNVITVKLDNAGIYQWHTFINHDDSSDASGYAAISDGSGIYVAGSTVPEGILGGSSSSTLLVLKIAYDKIPTSVQSFINPINESIIPHNHDLKFQWNSSLGASEYLLEWWSDLLYAPTRPCGWSSSTSCSIGTVLPGTYYWRVKARNIYGESNWSATWSFTISNPPLAVEINQSASQPDPTTIDPVNFTSTFSEPIDVSSFTSGDITLSGITGMSTITISQIAPNNGTTFNIAVSGMGVSGTVTASLGEGKVASRIGTSNTISESTDNRVTYYAETDTVCQSVPVIASGQDKFGSLIASDDTDPYKFDVPTPYTTITATLTPPTTGDFDLYLYNGCDDNQVNTSWGLDQAEHIGRRHVHIGPGGGTEVEVRFNVGKETGTYYLAAAVPQGGTHNTSQYKLHLELQPPNFSLVKTLILYNPVRFKAQYGLESASQVMDKLTQLADDPSVNGVIVQLDQFPSVVTAYNNWDNTPVVAGNENSYKANVASANLVSNEIRKAMLEFMQANRKLVTGYVVVVGDDDQIPFRRLNINPNPLIGDPNWSSERDYFLSLGDTANTPIDAAMMADQTLSDDFYGDYLDRPWMGSLPGLSVGRLLDTPVRIQNIIDAFFSSNGEVDLTAPGSSAVAGYDFLTDAAQQACSYLQANSGLSMDCTLIDTLFAKSNLSQKFIASAPNINGYYGHSNHSQIFVPSGNPLDAQEISSALFDPASSLWWVIGCQSGLALPKSENQPLSLTQALGDHGVTYLGNTGWAWGGDGPLNHSELLYQLVIKQLKSNSGGSVAIGDALRLGKRDYLYKSINNFNGTGGNYYLSYYDGKVMAEATLYGLPMLKFNFPYTLSAQAAFKQPEIVAQSDVTGLSVPLQFHSVSVTPHNLTAILQQHGANTFYMDSSGNYSAEFNTPLIPQSEYLNFDTSLGQGKGVIWISGIYNILTNNNPLVLRPTQLNANPGAEPTYNGVYPLLPVALAGLEELNGAFTNHLTFQTGQYIGSQTNGSLRRFSDMEFLIGLWQGAAADKTSPILGALNLSGTGDQLRVDLPVSDASGIYKAYVTYTIVTPGAVSGTWQSVELTSGSPACTLGQQTYSLNMPLTTDVTNYFIQVMDCAGNVSVLMDNGKYYTASNYMPFVHSISRADASPTTAAVVNFNVTFSEPVTSVDANDFRLFTTGVAGASIVDVTGSEANYVVAVNTGSGNGTVWLDVIDNDTIVDTDFNPLGGLGLGNGGLKIREKYSVKRPVTIDFHSSGANDGWVLESKETSNIANTKMNMGSLRVGDDAKNRQYRSLLYFDTANLPNNAVITKATVQIIQSGTDTIDSLGNLVADMKKGLFGLSPLETGDFSAIAAPINTAGKFNGDNGTYTLMLSPANFKYINLLGVTQFRVRFTKDDDNDKVADFISFYSGNDLDPNNQPQLIVEYYVP